MFDKAFGIENRDGYFFRLEVLPDDSVMDLLRAEAAAWNALHDQAQVDGSTAVLETGPLAKDFLNSWLRFATTFDGEAWSPLVVEDLPDLSLAWSVVMALINQVNLAKGLTGKMQ